jgi:hypothetical protein
MPFAPSIAPSQLHIVVTIPWYDTSYLYASHLRVISGIYKDRKEKHSK